MTASADAAAVPRRDRLAAVASLLFLSGLASLVYQTVWLRQLRSVFGASTPATSAVIGIFMGGLGLGGLLLGRRADRHPNPLLLYARLEAGIATTALLSIPLVRLVEAIYFASGGSPRLGLVGATVLRLLLAVVVLGAPTFLMGGTLPAVAQAVTAPGDAKRRAVALLYGVNTLGALAGTVGSTFFALEVLGNKGTLAAAALLNVAVAGVAGLLSRGAGAEAEADAGVRDESPSPPPAPATPVLPSPLPTAFAQVASAVAGFSFLVLELVWYRMLSPILGGSTFTFGLILGMVLLGIGLGGLLYSLLLDDRPAPARLLATTCGLEALAIVAPFAAGDRLAILAALLRPLDALGFGGRILGWTVLCAIVVLPAAIVSGFQLPALIALVGRGNAHAGRDVGRVYASNTLGAIAGSLAGGFGLMPLLTAPGCWKLAAWLMLALGLATIVVVRMGGREAGVARLGLATAVLAGVLLVTATGPTAAWRHTPIGAGRVDLSRCGVNDVRDWAARARGSIVWEADGRESSVALDGLDGYAFILNGKSDGHAIGDAPTQVMGGLLGTILHPAPRRSLVIGLGTGSTAGWLGKVPGMERVDVAELEPVIRRVAEECTLVNQDVLRQPNVHVFYGDAREVLLTSPDRYDVIFSEPSNPFRAGIASLFTRELYSAARERLGDRGFFVQWVQAYEIDGPTVETIMRTVHGVFGHVQVWQTVDKDMLLVASRFPIQVDADQLRARIVAEPYHSALRLAWRVDSVEGLLAHLVADEALPAQVAANGFAVNTDDRNVVEFGLARTVGSGSSQVLADIRAQAALRGLVDRSIRGAFDPALVHRYRTTSSLIAGSYPSEDQALARLVAAHRSGRFADAARMSRELAFEPRSHSETLILAECLASTGDAGFLAVHERLRAYDPVEALFLAATYLNAKGRRDLALDALAQGFTLCREWPWASRAVAARAVALASELVAGSGSVPKVQALWESVGKPFALRQFEEGRRSLLLNAAIRLEGGCGPKVAAALALLEPNARFVREVLRVRASCYATTKNPLAAEAARDYAEFLSHETEPFGSRLGAAPATARP